MGQRVGRREHAQPRAVLGRVARAIQAPAQAVPLLAGRERDLAQRLGVRIRDHVVALHPIPAPVRLERHVDIDARQRGERRLAPGQEVLLPIVLLRLLRGGTLEAVLHREVERRARDQRHERERQQREQGPPQRRRTQALDDPGGIVLAAREHAYRDRREQQREPQHLDSVENQSAPIELEHAHVGPTHGAPQIPVPHPVHAMSRLEQPRHHERRQPEAVRGEPVARRGEAEGHERGPHEQRRDEQQAPHDREWPEAHRHLALHQQHQDRAGEAGEDHDRRDDRIR